MAPHRQPRTAPAHMVPPAPARPVLSDRPSQFLLLEREVEDEFRPQMLQVLQRKVNAVADSSQAVAPDCARCARPMGCHDTRPVSWLARCGRLHVPVSRYRCPTCQLECRPLLDQLGGEPGRISGSLARILVLLAVVAPYPLAARLAWLLLGVKISPMGIWRVAQRLGEAAARYSDDLSRYHGDSRSAGALAPLAPTTVVMGVDGCALGMQVRQQRRRRKAGEPWLPPLPVVEDGQFREVKTGVRLLPDERVESSPGRRSPRRFPVSVRRFSLAPTPRLVAIPCSSSLSFPIWPPVETSRLGDISIVVTLPKGDISNVAAWGHYQSRAKGFSSLPGEAAVHAFLWQKGVMTDLGTLGGPNSLAAFPTSREGRSRGPG